MEELYSRQLRLPELGVLGQKRLCQSAILVVGLGGLGCAALPSLAAAGIGRIGLVDFDRVELSNLPRQLLYGPADIGRLKVEAAYDRLTPLYPHTRFEVHPTPFDGSLASGYDCILDATDNAGARYAINDACRAHQKPWVYGAIDQWHGQAALFLPPSDYRALFTSDASPATTCSLGGVLGAFVQFIGALQALLAIQHLAEIAVPRKLFLVNAKTWRITLASLSPPPSAPSLGDCQLIDVREPDEKKNGDLGGECNPFSCFDPSRLLRDRKIVLYCQSGARSEILASKLREMGYDAHSLPGGVADRLSTGPLKFFR